MSHALNGRKQSGDLNEVGRYSTLRYECDKSFSDKSLAESLAETLGESLDYMHDSRRDSLRDLFFTFSSHTEYVKRESIIIGLVKKKILSFLQMFMICMS